MPDTDATVILNVHIIRMDLQQYSTLHHTDKNSRKLAINLDDEYPSYIQYST